MGRQKRENNRTAGFLQPNERAYLAEESLYFGEIDADAESGGKRSRSRIKNEVVSGRNFEDLIDSFHQDLLAVVYFQLHTDAQEQINWRRGTLAPAKPRIMRLRDHLNTLIDMAESEYVVSEREELREALTPLFRPIEREFDGDWDASERKFDFDEGEEAPGPELLEQIYERQKELHRLLKITLNRDGRLEILNFLAESGKTELTGHRIGDDGEPWARVASREFVPDLVAKDDTWKNKIEYELTDQGRAVLDCWSELRQTTSVQIKKDLNPEMNERELVLDLLAEHFPDNYE